MNMPFPPRIFAADLSPDAPVSNHEPPPPSTPGFKRIVESGSVGSAGGEVGDVAESGTESVPGHNARLTPDAATWRPDTSRPADVAWATFGPPPPIAEALVGDDDRVRVADPSLYPWRVNCSLQILLPDGQIGVGTGWFMGPRTLVTAGHCVFIHEQYGRYRDWARAIRVMPGRNGTLLAFGAVVSTTFHSVAGWARDKDARYDYGVIVLPSDLGSTVGWASLGVLDDGELVNKVANIAGYPGDKRNAEDGTQWYDARQIMSVDSHSIHYMVDTWAGQSGSAVHIIDGKERLAVGIHAYGDSYFGNSATRITPSVHANLMRWRQ
jgi:glutamyl endopeptidase